ncbi:MAG TPA: hypothetical protein VN175_01080 [Rhizomicrobium sp.]|nr:hypothetical protein [Rhizomicrobium sp.]
MSAWKFKDAQKTHDALILHFSDLAHPPWGDTMSVTIPAADAAKLMARLQAILHPASKS